MAQSMGCGAFPDPYENPSNCPPSQPGGYQGFEMTTHLGPFPGKRSLL
jgi:hypothetical protein